MRKIQVYIWDPVVHHLPRNPYGHVSIAVIGGAKPRYFSLNKNDTGNQVLQLEGDELNTYGRLHHTFDFYEDELDIDAVINMIDAFNATHKKGVFHLLASSALFSYLLQFIGRERHNCTSSVLSFLMASGLELPRFYFSDVMSDTAVLSYLCCHWHDDTPLLQKLFVDAREHSAHISGAALIFDMSLSLFPQSSIILFISSLMTNIISWHFFNLDNSDFGMRTVFSFVPIMLYAKHMIWDLTMTPHELAQYLHRKKSGGNQKTIIEWPGFDLPNQTFDPKVGCLKFIWNNITRKNINVLLSAGYAYYKMPLQIESDDFQTKIYPSMFCKALDLYFFNSCTAKFYLFSPLCVLINLAWTFRLAPMKDHSYGFGLGKVANLMHKNAAFPDKLFVFASGMLGIFLYLTQPSVEQKENNNGSAAPAETGMVTEANFPVKVANHGLINNAYRFFFQHVHRERLECSSTLKFFLGLGCVTTCLYGYGLSNNVDVRRSTFTNQFKF